ncbi:hypothetical protein JAAARDRAFT_198328 [Jaapia argillacea MUCL 33604]|uniref:Uncharacterized protein n=1 Tax=Jaapia argillacea MUCL 33604 TaxID=933084 RepID=A0A067PBX6_9AGAM|nr:hypothetical protein JAAARDRAFT_198328 [Jaapia argillacea MUCL 33604]
MAPEVEKHYTVVLSPQHHPEITTFTTYEPLHRLLLERKETNLHCASRRKIEAWEKKTIEVLLNRPVWVYTARHLILWCTGVEPDNYPTIKAFIQYIALTTNGKMREAYDILDSVQVDTVKSQKDELLGRVNLTGLEADEDEDKDENEDEDEDEEDHEVDNYADVDNMGNAEKPPLLTARMVTAWRKWYCDLPDRMLSLCQWGAQSLEHYFFSDFLWLDCDEHHKVEWHAVEALHALQSVDAIIWKSMSWQSAVQTSGLCETIAKICVESTAVELTHPHVLLSFQYHCWRETLGEVLAQWGPDFPIAPPSLIPQALPSADRLSGQQFLKILNKFPYLIPRGARPTCVFFLSSLDNFLEVWTSWLCPTLNCFGYKEVNSTNPKSLYQEVLKEMKSTDVVTNIKDNNLRAILKETMLLRNQSRVTQQVVATEGGIKIQKALQKDQLPHFNCLNCKNEDESNHCVHYLEVEEDKKVKDLIGGIITCADEDDVLLPKNSKGKETHIYSLEDLKLMEISHCPEVFARCGRDVVYLINKENNICVGGIVYKPKVDAKTQNTLHQGHRIVTSQKSVKVAVGRRSGDAYAAYATIDANHSLEVELLFHHAKDTSTLLDLAFPYFPFVVHNLTDVGRTAGIDPLGKQECNMYYCDSYTAPQHRDRDATLSLCMQFQKVVGVAADGTPHHDEFGFAFTQWGVWVQTDEDSIW